MSEGAVCLSVVWGRERGEEGLVEVKERGRNLYRVVAPREKATCRR